MIVNFVREFYAKCNRTVVHTSSMPHDKMIYLGAMTRVRTFTVAAVALFCSTAAATSPLVTFVSPCECRDAHGKGRWTAKNDVSLTQDSAQL